MIDSTIRTFLKKRLRGMYVTSIEIERAQTVVRILVKTSRPGLIIGRGGEGSQKLTKDIQQVVSKMKLPAAGAGILSMPKMQVRVDIEVREVPSPESPFGDRCVHGC